MKIGIGIDTGGTYTDAVMYDFLQQKIIAAAKALTTKEDLSVGIGHALDGLPAELLRSAKIVSLSTTLATNACVEEKGGRGKLIFIGADRDVVARTGQSYGLPGAHELFFLDGEVNLAGDIIREPDWQAFLRDCREWLSDADAVAVVQQLGVRNAENERKAKEWITTEFGLTTVCGYELFSDLNYIKRGAGALLNARLVPVIGEFLEAIRISLTKRAIEAPVVIVRSDGSLMSESFTSVRPVETLLCGPAASVIGSMELTGLQNSVIVDMGGTTCDMALVRDGMPVKTLDGVQIGRWQTFVKAVYIDTFGLGGDSRLYYDKNRQLKLGSTRVIPFCIAAERWPNLIDRLRNLLAQRIRSAVPLFEYFCIAKKMKETLYYTQEEQTIYAALHEGPLNLAEIAAVIQKRSGLVYLERLEQEGIIMRCGLTPTDMMHIKGDFTRFNIQAARLCAEYVAFCLGATVGELADQVYDAVKKTLYTNIVRMLLCDKYHYLRKNGLDEGLMRIISDSWNEYRQHGMTNFLTAAFGCPAALVGVGAPTHIFLPDVAAALGTTCVVPPNAAVANAVGAIVGNIAVTREIEIKSEYAMGGGSGYIVFGSRHNRRVHSLKEALQIASEEASLAARQEAASRGAAGDITVTTDASQVQEQDGLLLGGKVSATAIGRVIF